MSSERSRWLVQANGLRLYHHATHETLRWGAIRVQRSGARLVFTAGACPLDEDGRVVAPRNCEAQAARATENLLAALATHHLGAESLVKTTIYVLAEGRADLVCVWDVRPVPARTNTEYPARGLGYPDQLVKIEAIAIAKTE